MSDQEIVNKYKMEQRALIKTGAMLALALLLIHIVL
jgi:hypothetical protein